MRRNVAVRRSIGRVMELEGIVQNAMVVVEHPQLLPEGAKVKILIEMLPPTPRQPTLAERLLKHAGTVPHLPPDLAEQHDHHLHGTPKMHALWQ